MNRDSKQVLPELLVFDAQGGRNRTQARFREAQHGPRSGDRHNYDDEQVACKTGGSSPC